MFSYFTNNGVCVCLLLKVISVRRKIGTELNNTFVNSVGIFNSRKKIKSISDHEEQKPHFPLDDGVIIMKSASFSCLRRKKNIFNDSFFSAQTKKQNFSLFSLVLSDDRLSQIKPTYFSLTLTDFVKIQTKPAQSRFHFSFLCFPDSPSSYLSLLFAFVPISSHFFIFRCRSKDSKRNRTSARGVHNVPII